MAAETQHRDLATDSTLAAGLARDARLRAAFLLVAYGAVHALALAGAVLLAVTLAGVLPGGPVALAWTIFGGAGLIAAAPALVDRGFERAFR